LIGAGLESIDSNVLSKCVALASTLHLTPDTMAEVWEAHSLNKQNLTELTMHQFEAYKNELIKASSTAPTPDLAKSSSDTTPRGATVVSRKPSTKRDAMMVTPTSSSKRPKHQSPDAPISSVDRVAIDGNSVPSPVRSNSSGATQVIKKTPPNLPKYEERTKVGHVIASYSPDSSRSGDSNADTNGANAGQQRCVLTTTTTATKSLGGNDDDENHWAEDDVTRHNIKESYRHMFTTLEDRATALEGHLVQMKDAIVEDITSQKKKESGNNSTATTEADDGAAASFEEVNVPRQYSSTCVGRICNEAHQGKLNATSVVLEGSSFSCGGARVNVDLSHMPNNEQSQQQQHGYSLFPGQIVAVEGMNGTGRKVTATRLREGAPLPPSMSSTHAIRKFYHSGEAPAPVKVISACGPFTASNNMDYAPFVDLLNVVLEQKPDVVILMGPFVDARHEAVRSGRVKLEVVLDNDDGEARFIEANYEAVFADKIAGMISEALEEDECGRLETEFVLVPALEDATAKFVYPQPPLEDRLPKGGKSLNIPGGESFGFGTMGLHELTKARSNGKRQVHCLSNPCTFRINELVFGVTSTDVLFHLSVEETNARLPPGSRMRRIAQHMVNQQSYYPLFPPNKAVNLDMKQKDGWRMPCQPDVLLVPSRLTPFCAPVLGNTMVINPGQLTKGTTGGSYSVMNVHPIKKERLNGAEDSKITHHVQDRMEVVIKKI